MTSQLFIRPGYNDHGVVADLLVPGGVGIWLPRRRPLVAGLVIEAQVANRRPQFAQTAADTGVPLLIDPMTPLLQAALRPEDPWARLPFGIASEVEPGDLADPGARDDLVERVVDFQLSHGATILTPPYPYVPEPSSPWFEIALDLLRRTRATMQRRHLGLPLAAVLCVRLQAFGTQKSWADGIDRFARSAAFADPLFIGLALSPTGGQHDSYHKLERAFSTSLHLRETGIPVIAWRQGIYGPALVAAGLDGYETGIGTRERTDLAGLISSRKPNPSGGANSGPGGLAGVYLEPIGRSLPRPAAETLLGNVAFAAKVVCDDQACCPDGAQSMLSDRRHHAVRTRSRRLAEIDDIPNRTWKLREVARQAHEALALVNQANNLLTRDSHHPLAPDSLSALERVADHLGHLEARSA